MNPPPVQPLPVVMTTEEVAELLRCPAVTVERYVYRHRLMAVQIGRQRRFRADDVLEFIASRPSTARCDRQRLRRRNAEMGDSVGR